MGEAGEGDVNFFWRWLNEVTAFEERAEMVKALFKTARHGGSLRHLHFHMEWGEKKQLEKAVFLESADT